MKKYAVRIIVFVLLFCILFGIVQSIIHYRWSGNEDLYTRNLDYMSQQEGSIDVLYFGTSEIYAMCAPIVTYGEQGITGYNFAITKRSAITAYYQLLFALKHQTPKVVVCDFCSLFQSYIPNGSSDALYRKVADTMPDKELKEQFIRGICFEFGKDQDYLTWKFPLLRYHSMWNELTEDNFKRDYVYDETYPGYKKGAVLDTDSYSVEGFTDADVTEGLWNAEPSSEEYADISIKYYDMFIEECKSRGIEVVAVFPPIVGTAEEFSSRRGLIMDYVQSRGIKCLDYDDYEQYKRMGLVLDEDYYDMDHMNYHGATKASAVMAEDLKKMFDLPDKRKDPEVAPKWDEEYKEFLDFLSSEEELKE